MTEVEKYNRLMAEGQGRTIFVFGSNLAGRHGKGAALTAATLYEAERGVGEGLTGQCYALPTKDENLAQRPLDAISASVRQFNLVARENPKKLFLVTRVGCGLAGYTDHQIAPMFEESPANVILPTGWDDIINAVKRARVTKELLRNHV